jgi:hypothetical protein
MSSINNHSLHDGGHYELGSLPAYFIRITAFATGIIKVTVTPIGTCDKIVSNSRNKFFDRTFSRTTGLYTNGMITFSRTTGLCTIGMTIFAFPIINPIARDVTTRRRIPCELNFCSQRNRASQKDDTHSKE